MFSTSQFSIKTNNKLCCQIVSSNSIDGIANKKKLFNKMKGIKYNEFIYSNYSKEQAIRDESVVKFIVAVKKEAETSIFILDNGF